MVLRGLWAHVSCSMPFPIGALGQHYDLDADAYFQGHDKDSKMKSAVELMEQAKKLLGRTGRLLDVGVGRGEVLIAAKDRDWDVEGVEPSESFADYAKERIGVKIWRHPVENATIPSNSFDVVILGAVLEHLYNPDLVMRKVAEILRPGGLLYVDVPNEGGLYFRVGNIYQRLRGRDWCVNLAPTFSPFHVFGFGPKSLRKLLKKYGLTPQVWTVYGGTSLVSAHGGLIGMVEKQASRAVTALSNLGEMGTYIETWAVKK